jgi:hypothetical protein
MPVALYTSSCDHPFSRRIADKTLASGRNQLSGTSARIMQSKQTALLDHLSVLYFVHDSMVKVSMDNEVYYHVGKFYYNRQGEEISKPLMNVKFERYIEVFKMLKLICSG